MVDKDDLIRRLCQSLAFHLIESEITFHFAEGETAPWLAEISNAKALISEAGFDLDVIYPIADRPIAEEANVLQ